MSRTLPLLNQMAVQDNSNSSESPHAFPQGIPTLVEVTDQIASSESSSDSEPQTPQVVFVSNGGSSDQSLEVQQNNPTGPSALTWQSQTQQSAGSRFLVDPFAHAVDGPIPVMPSLPVVNAIEMTEKVVSREKTGEHYAWRLKPGPYPALGNISQVGPKPDGGGTATNEPSASGASELANEPSPELEVVAEGDSSDYGDNFYAQAGDVISIDGNQGYDHIDLRSYDIADATFQPGAILLSGSTVDDSDTPADPIIIRHRGIEFAIFRGEERVEL